MHFSINNIYICAHGISISMEVVSLGLLCSPNKKTLSLLNEESISGESSGRAIL